MGNPIARIAVIGATRSGKTLFVNKASKSDFEVGTSNRTDLDDMQWSNEFELDGRQVMLIDTPGFSDTGISDTQVLDSIKVFLEVMYSEGTKLTGIVYVHSISNSRLAAATIRGFALRNFHMIKELCGEGGLQNVVIMTSMWGQVTMPLGISREKELRGDQFFGTAIDRGARLLRYEDTPESACDILRTVIFDKVELSKKMREMMEKHNEEVGQLEERTQAMGREKEELRAELDEERRNSRGMGERVGQLERSIEAMGREKEGLRGELDEEKRNSRGMTERIGQLERSVQAMGREKEELRGKLDEEKSNSKGMMEKRDKDIEQLKEEKEKLRGKLDGEKRKSKEMMEKHDKDIERQEREMRVMEELRRELDKGKENSEKEAKRLEGLVVEMQAKDKEKEELRRKLEEESSSLEEENRSLEEDKRSLEEEVKKLEGSVDEMWAEILKERQKRKGWGLMEQFGWGATGGATDKIPYGVERKGRGSGEASRTRRVVSMRRTFDRLDRSSTDFGHKLNEVLHTPKYKEWVSSQTFKNDELMWFIDYLDTALESLDPSAPASRKCMRELKTICRTHSILPTSYAVSPNLIVKPDRFTSGGYADVHEGTLGSTRVCVKRVWVAGKDAQLRSTQMVCEEAVMWKYLKHQNILPLLGTSVSPPQLVSPFKTAGNLSEYLKKHPGARGLRILSEVAEGLYYLHSRNVIHGDLKGINVLVDVVDNSPHALLADFGIAIVTQNPHSIQDPTCQGGYSLRWTAPEVLKGKNPSKESDVFSFAMVAIEVFSGQLPFNGKPDQAVGVSILSGERPKRPEHLSCTNDLWIMIRRCWDEDHLLRPEMPEVRRYFDWASQN